MRRDVFCIALSMLMAKYIDKVWRALLGGWEPGHDVQYLCK
jgi:hypothetical protein